MNEVRNQEQNEAHNASMGGTVGQMMINTIIRHAERPCLADDNTHWSYAEYGDTIARYIAVYKQAGLKRGEGLSILAGNRVEVMAASVAAIIMGLRYTPLHPLASEDDHTFIIEDAEITALICDPTSFGERAVRIAQTVKTVRTLFSFGPLENAHDLLADAKTVTPAPLKDEADADTIAYIAYTGGTTGRPKGVVHKPRGLITAILHMISDWDWPDDIRFLACTPISHAAGATSWPVLIRGGFTRLAPGFNPKRFFELIETEKLNTSFMVPTMIYVLLDDPELKHRDLSSLQTIIYGAAPMSPERMIEAIGVFGNVFVQLYGQTEAPNVITTLRKIDHDINKPARLGSCGLPSLFVDVEVFDSDMKPVGIGEPGEICVRGPIVMVGYWKRPEETAEALKGGWLHTGDVAVRDADGYLTIVDRAKDMIISGGFNIYPREVEDALLAHPAIASAAVIGVPDAKWGEAVKAFVALKPGAQVKTAELQAHVKARRGALWAPKSVEFMEAIPVTGLGKVDRKALRKAYWSEDGRQVS
ncbi:MAG: acyl-CoA synthetase [Robiginitomaculum sp.]|nr:MAG: acyl-CoA synthetase [Robiginitomaculum sp.]